MIRKEDLSIIIREQNQSLKEESEDIPRTSLENIDLESRQALVVSGVRRCGKSTFIKQLMRLNTGFYFMTFEDLRLTDFEPTDFERVEEVFTEEFGNCDFYFFDEIQNIAGWEQFIRQKLDQRRKVIITGSNAHLLSRELGTHLTGRHLDYELFPFTYDEYLAFFKIGNTAGSFMNYLVRGGFPEFLHNKKSEYLQTLMTDILIRDIAVRRGIRNVKTLKEIAVFLMSNLGKEFSFHSLRKTFSVGSVSTVIEYMSFFEECYLLFTIPKFDYSLKKQAYHPKKVYAVDNGLAIANSLSFSSDTGRMLENLVFVMLRRKHHEIYYFKNQRECDFVIKERGAIHSVIQVCARLNSDNKLREIEGLFEAMVYFDLNEGFLLTIDEDDELRRDGRLIHIISLRNFKV